MDDKSIQQPYDNLTPDVMLDALESTGYEVSGSLFALNSYENRVYQVGLNDGTDIIAKFYRPARWSDEAILEEHAFSQELADNEIPVVAPLEIKGKTLFFYEGYRFAVFRKHGGRGPELDNPEHLKWLGRFMGRIHAVGRTKSFQFRHKLTPEYLGEKSVAFLLTSDFIPEYLQHNYQVAAEAIMQVINNQFEACMPFSIRIHGDCHPGNILWTDDGPHFVDLDDTCMGPAIQDLWMLLSGDAGLSGSRFIRGRAIADNARGIFSGHGPVRTADPRQNPGREGRGRPLTEKVAFARGRQNRYTRNGRKAPSRATPAVVRWRPPNR